MLNLSLEKVKRKSPICCCVSVHSVYMFNTRRGPQHRILYMLYCGYCLPRKLFENHKETNKKEKGLWFCMVDSAFFLFGSFYTFNTEFIWYCLFSFIQVPKSKAPNSLHFLTWSEPLGKLCHCRNYLLLSPSPVLDPFISRFILLFVWHSCGFGKWSGISW